MEKKFHVFLILVISIELIFAIETELIFPVITRKSIYKTIKRVNVQKQKTHMKHDKNVIKKVNIHHLNGIWNRIG